MFMYCNEFPLVFLIFRDMDAVLCYVYWDYGRNGRVSRLKRSTWYEWIRGDFWTGQTIQRGVVFFFLFFIYVSFLHFFHLKESTDKQRTKRMQQKNIQKCRGHFAPNSVWLGPSNKTKYFFFFFHRRTRVSPLRLYGCTNFNQIGFPPKLAADEQPQKCFFGTVLIRTFI